MSPPHLQLSGDVTRISEDSEEAQLLTVYTIFYSVDSIAIHTESRALPTSVPTSVPTSPSTSTLNSAPISASITSSILVLTSALTLPYSSTYPIALDSARAIAPTSAHLSTHLSARLSTYLSAHLLARILVHIRIQLQLDQSAQLLPDILPQFLSVESTPSISTFNICLSLSLFRNINQCSTNSVTCLQELQYSVQYSVQSSALHQTTSYYVPHTNLSIHRPYNQHNT